MFSQKHSVFTSIPRGVKKDEIPYSKIESLSSTKELVLDIEPDAFYFRSLEKEGIFLNKPQLDAVRNIDGSCLIIAGAGSGKTRVLTTRAGYILTFNKAIKPHNIMLVTFTKKAAEEMLVRIQGLPGISKKMANDILTGTFHSIFLRILRNIGYDQKILSNERYKDLIVNKILSEQGMSHSYESETILALISSYKSNLLRPQDLQPKTPIEREIQSLYEMYESEKREKHLIDFDDILLESYFSLKNNSSLLQRIQERIKYIQVDEYQDVNFAQHELIKLIVNKKSSNVFFVGDEDQVIYNFRNASPDYILNLHREFQGLKTITLNTNYRSTNSIVGLGNEIIKYNKQRLGKVLLATKKGKKLPFYLQPSDINEEAVQVVDSIQEDVINGERRYKDFAILYRTHNNSRAIFDELVLREIPFIIKNAQVFYEQPIVKPILDYLRLSINPNNLNAIEGICPTLLLNKEKAIQHILSNSLDPGEKNMLRFLLKLPNLKPFHLQKIFARVKFIETIKSMTPKEAIREIRKGVPKYDEYLSMDERKTLTFNKEFIDEMLDELEASAERFHTIPDYLTFVSKIISKNNEMEELRKQGGTDCVNLMTIHASKGLEFHTVYVIGFSEEILPHKSAINAGEQNDRVVDKSLGKKDIINGALEEERRLAYVAVTRAEEELYISSPRIYRGKEINLSLFLLEAFS